MITIRPEKWLDMQLEVAALTPQHWQEIALNHDDVPLDPAWEKYSELDCNGALLCIAVREDNRLVGYHLSILTTHLHYKSTLHCITDVYYLLPDYRRGFTGIKLMRAVEANARAHGAKLLVTGTKLHLDMGVIFKRLGYSPAETIYKKVLK